MSSSRNRFQFDGDDEPQSGEFQSNRQASSGPSDTNEIYYVDEPEARFQRKSRVGWIIGAGLAVILLSGLAFWYFFYYSPNKKADPAITDRFSRVDEAYRDRYFIPEEKVSAELGRSIELYRGKEFHQAKLGFEKFIESSANNIEKAIAEVFLGILAMERSRLTLAEHHFLRALRFSPGYLPALVNLAIVKRKAGDYEKAREYAEQARQINPRDPRVTGLLANILAESQQTDQAIEAYDDALHSDPEDATSHYNKALTLLRSQRIDEAILSFSRANNLGDGRIKLLSHAHLAQIYVQRGNLELARHHLEQAVGIAPDNGKYYYNLGVVELRMGERKAALSSFERALRAGSNEPRIYRSLAQAFEGMQQPSQAIRALQKALYINATDLPTLFALAELYTRQHDLLNAADTYAKIVNITPGDQNTREALLKLAAVYTQMERYNDAVSMLEKARGLDPDEIRTYYLLGQVYDKSGKRHLALEAWKKALALHGQNQLGGSQKPLDRGAERQIRMAIAQTYLDEGAPDLALKELRQIESRNQESPAITSDPRLDMAYADAYLMSRDYSNAIASLQKAANSPDLKVAERKRVYVQLALAHQKLAQKDSQSMDQARAWANKAVRLDPLDPEPRLMQAGILMETGSLVDQEKALEILLAVTKSDLDADVSSRAWNLLGLCYMKNSEYKRALQAFDYAVQLNPANKEAYRNQRVAAKSYEQSL